MINIGLFVEDDAHERFIKRFIKRFAEKYNVTYAISMRMVTGGYGAVIQELDSYVRDLNRMHTSYFDTIIIVKDANCSRWQDMRRKILRKFTQFNTIFAIPEPHIERWYLIDPSAIKKVIGQGYTTPSGKCGKNTRDYYKQELYHAINQVGINPPLGGIEYAEDIVDNIDLDRVDWEDQSFSKFLNEMNNYFKHIEAV